MDKLNEKYRGVTAPVKKKLHINEKILFVVAGVAIVTIITLNILSSAGVISSFSPSVTMNNWPTMMPNATLLPGVTPDPLSINLGAHAKVLNIAETRINQPCVYGSELLFSAGDGPIEKPVLRTLYLFDTQTEVLTKIATSTINNGEIYESYLSDTWIVWLDTDHKGNNIIFKMNRIALPDMAINTITQVTTTANNSPKLRLSGNLLVWLEQLGDNDDELYVVNLDSGEDIAIQEYTDTTYALSPAYIYQDTVIWAYRDPEQTADEEKANPKSVIKSLAIDFSADAPDSTSTLEPDVTMPPDATDPPTLAPDATDPPDDTSGDLNPTILIDPDMYVHEPMSNSDVVIWIDKNKAPDSNLFMSRSGGAPTLVHKNVTSYSLGTDFIVYNYNQTVFAYFYDKNITVQLSEDTMPSILPRHKAM